MQPIVLKVMRNRRSGKTGKGASVKSSRRCLVTDNAEKSDRPVECVTEDTRHRTSKENDTDGGNFLFTL